MPKNKGTMGKSASTATAVEAPDPFVSGGSQVAERLRPHAKLLVALAVAIALALVALAVWRWQARRAAVAATSLYHRALLLQAVPVAPPATPSGPAADGSTTPSAPAAAEGDTLRDVPGSYADPAARATAVLGVLDSLEREHGGTTIALHAELLRAENLLELGRADDAVAAYRRFAGESRDGVLRRTALEGIGYALEASALAKTEPAQKQAGLEAALAAFKEVEPDSTKPGHARALYHEGRILELLGRRPDAVQRYTAALAVAGDGSLRSDIEARLAGGSATSGDARSPADPAPAGAAATAGGGSATDDGVAGAAGKGATAGKGGAAGKRRPGPPASVARPDEAPGPSAPAAERKPAPRQPASAPSAEGGSGAPGAPAPANGRP